ncbi:hypothetical protein Tco_0549224 [Tanacetum coccineum]
MHNTSRLLTSWARDVAEERLKLLWDFIALGRGIILKKSAADSAPAGEWILDLPSAFVPDAYTYPPLPRVPLSYQASACSLSTVH